jgi:hypothetical protein
MMCKKLFFLVSFVLVLSLFCSNAFGAAVVERRISAGSDDAEEAVNEGNQDTYNTSSDLEILDDNNDNGGRQFIGLNFRDISIAPGADISRAYIEFVCDASKFGSGDAYLLLWGHLAPNPDGFANPTPTMISDRPQTQAKVPWEPEEWTAAGQVSQTADISDIIRELINQEGWSSGNAIEIIIGEDTSKPEFTGFRNAESFNGSPALAPLLHIELSTPFASGPIPADGFLLEDTWVSLMWDPGRSSVSHDVYMGDNLADVEAGAESAFQGNQTSAMFITGFPGMAYPEGLVPGTTYYWRIDEVEADGSTKYTGAVWSFMIPSKTAYNPSPADGGKYVDPDVLLSWTIGFVSKLHTVYFGDNFDDVNNAAGGLTQAGATYTPGTLEMDKTYYWRVDEFDPPFTHKGNVWSFSTLPIIEIADPNLIGYWKFDEGSGSTGIDFSGYGNDAKLGGNPEWVEGTIGSALDLNGNDYITIDGVVDDITSNNITLSAWIRTTQAGEGNVFASNDGASNHVLLFGIDGGNIYVDDGPETDFPPAVNDDQWHMITFVLSGSRINVYTDGVQTGTITTVIDITTETRWSIGQEWDDSNPSDFYVGMVDEVRFYNVSLTADQVKELMRGDPLAAWNPGPNNNSTVDIKDARKPLSWSAGDEASQHDVYFGTDKAAVGNADASDTTGIYLGRQGGTSLTLPAGSVEWGGGPYYWRVDENNNDGSISTGATWSFSVADYLIVDDMESYNDINEGEPGSNRIFYTWLDGYDNPAINGAVVGYAGAPFTEQGNVHGGRQAMPLSYDNGVRNSEATLTLTDMRNWTEEGVGALTIWFRGETANAVVPLYVALNGNAVVTHDNLTATQLDTWTEWTIDLTRFADQGVNLSGVNTISIGLGNKSNPVAGGTGTMYIDDIRLYRPAP